MVLAPRVSDVEGFFSMIDQGRKIPTQIDDGFLSFRYGGHGLRGAFSHHAVWLKNDRVSWGGYQKELMSYRFKQVRSYTR